MEKVKIAASSKTYDVIIGSGILDKLGELSEKQIKKCKAALITDDIVDKLYSTKAVSSLKSSGFSVIKYVIPHGESSKTPENLLKIINFLAENNLTRSDAIFALGGGVVGDISGLSASLYCRGIKFIQIPTTLLAAVDSSVGGKTAVNLPSGKNLMGTFYQPDMVLCDYNVFDTLPDEIFCDGCAEVIKYGMIADKNLLKWLKHPIKDNIEQIIKRCISIKGAIVENDEHDNSQRQLLNFGHTIGHAIEKCSSYSISHGKAVAAGMSIITKASVKKGLCSEETESDLLKLLKTYNLPTQTNFNPEELYQVLLSDKKRKGDMITLVLPIESGKCVLKKMHINEVKDYIEKEI